MSRVKGGTVTHARHKKIIKAVSPPMAPPTVPATAREAPRSTPDVQLEIVLRNGRRLLVPSSVEPEVLARLLPALESR